MELQIEDAQKSYMEGNTFGKQVSDFVGGVLNTLSLGIIDAKKVSEFFSPSDKEEILKKEAKIANLKKSEATGAPEVVKKLEAELDIFKEEANQRAKEKKERAELRQAQDDYDKRRKAFIKDSLIVEKAKGKGLTRDQKIKAGLLTVGQYGGNFAERKFGKIFDEKVGASPMDKREAIEEKKKQDLRTIKLENDNFDKIKMKELNELKNPQLQKGSRLAKQTLIGLNDFGGSGTTINNNNVYSTQSDNSQTVNKNNGGKSVTPNVAQQLILSST